MLQRPLRVRPARGAVKIRKSLHRHNGSHRSCHPHVRLAAMSDPQIARRRRFHVTFPRCRSGTFPDCRHLHDLARLQDDGKRRYLPNQRRRPHRFRRVRALRPLRRNDRFGSRRDCRHSPTHRGRSDARRTPARNEAGRGSQRRRLCALGSGIETEKYARSYACGTFFTSGTDDRLHAVARRAGCHARTGGEIRPSCAPQGQGRYTG